MKCVITTAHRSRSAVERAFQIGMQRIVSGIDFNRPASYAEARLRLNAVVFGIDRKRPAAHIHEALFGIGRFTRFHAIGARVNRNISRANFHGILAVEAILDGTHVD